MLIEILSAKPLIELDQTTLIVGVVVGCIGVAVMCYLILLGHKNM